jgi:hypothetical protein
MSDITNLSIIETLDTQLQHTIESATEHIKGAIADIVKDKEVRTRLNYMLDGITRGEDSFPRKVKEWLTDLVEVNSNGLDYGHETVTCLGVVLTQMEENRKRASSLAGTSSGGSVSSD